MMLGLNTIKAKDEMRPVAKPHTAPAVLKRRQNNESTMTGRLADAATAKASATRNATLAFGPRTIAIPIEIAPTKNAVTRATRTSSPSRRSRP